MQDVDAAAKASMLVVSEFVGCSPSVSGALRVNPWSIDSVADGIYSAIKLPPADRHLRHDKHWRYVSQHTAKFWAQSFMSDLRKFTREHAKMKCYGLGLGLDSFRMVALMENFCKLDVATPLSPCQRCAHEGVHCMGVTGARRYASGKLLRHHVIRLVVQRVCVG